MKTNISKALRHLRVFALTLAASLASCTLELEHEPAPGEGAEGEQKVTLQLQVPGSSEGKRAATRAVGNNENEVALSESVVDDLYIMAFDDKGGFDYYTKARKTTTDGKWDAILLVREYEQTFVFAANVDGTEGADTRRLAELIATLKKGTKKEEALARLEVSLTANEVTNGFNAAASSNHRPFTMYGQTTADKTAILQGNLTVYLHRIMGRIQIHFGRKDTQTNTYPGIANFTPKSVHLYNTNNKARVFPANLQDTENNNANYVTTPSIPGAGVTLHKGPINYTIPAGKNQLIGQIYLFETKQPNPKYVDDETVHKGRTCLVIGGEYKDGKTYYYRVDLANPNNQDDPTQSTFLDVLRNHSYEVTVTAVTGEGHDTPDEAFEGGSGKIQTQVVAWNDGNIGNIDFIGDQFLGLGTMEYNLPKWATTITQEVTASRGLKWKAELLNENGTGSPDWITFAASGTTVLDSQTGTGTTAGYRLNVNEFAGQTGSRKAIMRFTAENLQLDAVVIQDFTATVFVRVVKTQTPNTEAEKLEFDETGIAEDDLSISFGGAANTTLYWELNYAGGLKFSGGTTVDGTLEMGDNGTVASGALSEKTISWKGISDAFPANPDFGSKTATLTVIAKNGDRSDAKTVRLIQSKYGLEIDKYVVVCTDNSGTTIQERLEQIGVKTNIESWSCRAEGAGYDAVVNDYIKPVEPQTGGKADTYGKEKVNITTLARPFDLVSKTFDLIFTDTKTGKEYPKVITVRTGWWYDGKLYEVISGQLSHTDKDADIFPAHTAGYSIVTYAQGVALNALTLVQPKAQICETSNAVEKFTGINSSSIINSSVTANWTVPTGSRAEIGMRLGATSDVTSCPCCAGTHNYGTTDVFWAAADQRANFPNTGYMQLKFSYNKKTTPTTFNFNIYGQSNGGTANIFQYPNSRWYGHFNTYKNNVGRWWAMASGYWTPGSTDQMKQITTSTAYDLNAPPALVKGNFGLALSNTQGATGVNYQHAVYVRWDLTGLLNMLKNPLADKVLPTYFVKEVKIP